MMKIRNIAIGAALALAIVACNKRDAGEAVCIERLDIALADSLDVPAVAERYAAPLRAIVLTQGLDPQPPEATARQIAATRYFKIFEPDVRRVLPDLTATEQRLGKALASLREKLDSADIPARTVGYVSPYNQRIVRVDSLMLIALNHYLGPDYPGYSGFDLYQRDLKRPDRIVPDVVEAVIAGSYPYDETTYSTALQRMLYEGATVSAMMQTIPDTNLAEALGWTEEQLKWAESNEARIWDKLAADGLIFTTSKIDIAKLTEPSPATAVVNPEAPGRLGRYVGYRIVESWVKHHPSTPLSRLFSPSFLSSPTVLQEARYTP